MMLEIDCSPVGMPGQQRNASSEPLLKKLDEVRWNRGRCAREDARKSYDIGRKIDSRGRYRFQL
jgi:hypothetical protein